VAQSKRLSMIASSTGSMWWPRRTKSDPKRHDDLLSPPFCRAEAGSGAARDDWEDGRRLPWEPASRGAGRSV